METGLYKKLLPGQANDRDTSFHNNEIIFSAGTNYTTAFLETMGYLPPTDPLGLRLVIFDVLNTSNADKKFYLLVF